MLGGRKRIDALEARLDRLASKVVVIETMYGMIAGLALRQLPDDQRDRILKELRKSITIKVTGHENSKLQVEEYAAQLLDQIEGLARRNFETPPS